MRKSVKRAFGLGILGGVAYAGWRAWNSRLPQRPRGVEWSTAPFPFPPVPHQTSTPVASVSDDGGPAAPIDAAPIDPAPVSWVEPNADGTCPQTHPVKAKLASGIYHVPGGANYARTKADRCYVDEASATADGLRPSKI